MVSVWSIIFEYTPWFIAIVAFVLLLEQINYLKRKRFLPGPTFVLPFLGSAISMVTNTTKFWEHQSSLAKSSPLGISANYIVGKFILYIYSTELSHKIFANVRPDGFHLIIHPFGKKLFGEHNIIYKFGQQHKDLRRSIAPNFTQKALSTYTSIQQKIILKHLKSWLEVSSKNPSEPTPLRILCRDMNLETSQTVFAGPYLSEDARKKFKVDYNFFNVGLMTLPFDFPGFAFREAKLAISRLIDTLATSAEESEKRMVNGEEPICLIDFWTQENLRAKTEAAEKTGEGGNDKSTFYCHKELGGHLFDFLFAAQDASTSSLLWAITFLESHPDILERVRLEVEKVWNPESSGPITGDQLREMKFTEAVAREVVRIRAPATMVPHSAAVDFQLTDDYVIPKGTIIFPSVFDSSFQGFTEPERFDPDRFMEERQEDRVYKRNFLAFGTGPHMCVGQRYALNHLMLFIAMFVTLVDFKRARTDGCDDLSYVPTIVPKDDCTVVLSQRCKTFPSLI